MDEFAPDLSGLDPKRLAWIAAAPPSELQQRAATLCEEPASLEESLGLRVGEEAQAFLGLDTRWFNGVLHEDSTPLTDDELRRLSFDLAEEAARAASEDARAYCAEALGLARRHLAGELDDDGYKAAREELSWLGRDPFVEMCFEVGTLPFCLETSGMTKEEYDLHRIFMSMGETSPQYQLTQGVLKARLQLALDSCGEQVPEASEAEGGASQSPGPFRVEVHSNWLVGEDSEHVDKAGLNALHGVELSALEGAEPPGALAELLGAPRLRFVRTGLHLTGRLMFESPRALSVEERLALQEWARGQLADGLGEDLRVTAAGREFHPWPVLSQAPRVIEALASWVEGVEDRFLAELAQIERSLLAALARPRD